MNVSQQDDVEKNEKITSLFVGPSYYTYFSMWTNEC